MELLQLRYFRDAAIYENFSETASIHLVPQSYISKTIKKLENELGISLFDRKGKKVILNENGKYFLTKINAALNLIDEGVAKFNEPTKSNLSVYVQAGNRFVSLIIADFLNISKDIYVSCINQTSEDMPSDSYDFTFMQQNNTMSDLAYETLIDDEIMVAVHEDLPLANKDIIDISELANEKFIGYFKTMNIRDFTDKYCKLHGFTPNVVFETADTTAFSYMLQKKEGIALVPSANWTLNFTKT